MKLGTNIHLMSGHCSQGFEGRRSDRGRMSHHNHHPRISWRHKSQTKLQGRRLSRIRLVSMLLLPLVCVVVRSAKQFCECMNAVTLEPASRLACLVNCMVVFCV